MSSIIRQIFNIFPRFSTKKAARRRCRAVFSFFPEQVVDGGAESGRQIVQLVVSDDSAAVLDPADDLLRDVLLGIGEGMAVAVEWNTFI